VKLKKRNEWLLLIMIRVKIIRSIGIAMVINIMTTVTSVTPVSTVRTATKDFIQSDAWNADTAADVLTAITAKNVLAVSGALIVLIAKI
jgi:hypothetical protein